MKKSPVIFRNSWRNISFEELRHWDRKILEDANETDYNYASQLTEHFRLQIKLLIAIHILSTYNEKLIGREHSFHYLQ